MAIFRAETKHISRSKGQNVVAAAAYRAGEKLTDTNKLNPSATTHDYTKKHGVLAKSIILPSELYDQGFSINRQDLWSSVEQHETTTRSVKGSRLKQTARLAREWLLSLPSELSDDENEQLTAEFTQKLANDLGVIGDYCIHKPTINNYKPKADYIESYDPDTQKPELTRVNDVKASEPDNRNIHAHIMFTTRKAKLTADGKLLLGEKADSERSEKWRKDNGMVNGGDYIKEVRGMWADMVNERLAQHEIAPISHKSYKELGLDIIPQKKEGKNATALSRYGIQTDVRNKNNVIKERNRAVIKSAADSYITGHNEAAERANTAANKAEQGTDAADKWLRKADIWLSKSAPTPFDSKPRITELNEQTIIFDRLAERANTVLSKPPRELIEQAIQKYNSMHGFGKWEAYIQKSDWGGGGIMPNPEPDPKDDFNQRQLDIIDNITQHLIGVDDDRVNNKVLRESLSQSDNERILTLLTNPEKEQLQYEQAEKYRTEDMPANITDSHTKQEVETAFDHEESTLAPLTPRNTYRPSL